MLDFFRPPSSLSDKKEYVDELTLQSLRPWNQYRGELSPERISNGPPGVRLSCISPDWTDWQVDRIAKPGEFDGLGLACAFPVGYLFREYFGVYRRGDKQLAYGQPKSPYLPRDIWSKDVGFQNEFGTAYAPTFLRGGESLSFSKTNEIVVNSLVGEQGFLGTEDNPRNPLVTLRGREYYLLTRSNIDPNLLRRTRQNEEENVDEIPVYKVGTTQGEKDAMNTIYKMVLAAIEPWRVTEYVFGRPEDHSVHQHHNDVTQWNAKTLQDINGKWIYPGSRLKEWSEIVYSLRYNEWRYGQISAYEAAQWQEGAESALKNNYKLLEGTAWRDIFDNNSSLGYYWEQYASLSAESGEVYLESAQPRWVREKMKTAAGRRSLEGALFGHQWTPPPLDQHGVSIPSWNITIPRYVWIDGSRVGPWVFYEEADVTTVQQAQYTPGQGEALPPGNPPQFSQTTYKRTFVWRYEGPDKEILLQSFGADQSVQEFLNVLGGPNNTRDINNESSPARQLFNYAFTMMNLDQIPYLSLLDFDLTSVGYILKWEQQYYGGHHIAPGTEEWRSDMRRKYDQIYAQYDKWIADWEEATSKLLAAPEQRQKLREEILKDISGLEIKGPEYIKPLTYDFSNGGLVQEVYLRVKELGEGQRDQYENENVMELNRTWIQKDRDDNLFGVVNIESFQAFINEKFRVMPTQQESSKLWRQITDQISDATLDCGEDVSPGLGSQRRGNADQADFRLDDFFEKISVGIRISYVSPLGESDTGWEELASQQDITSVDERSQLSKAYNVREERMAPIADQAEALPGMSVIGPGATGTITNAAQTKVFRTLRTVPIVSVEQPIDMSTSIVTARQQFEHLVQTVSVETYEAGQSRQIIGFFAHQFQERISRPDNNLIKQVQDTNEYKMLFKYLFPIDRMLSLNNIYLSTSLSTFKDADKIFDSTKVALKNLYFILENSGNPYCEPGPSNQDLLDMLLNGIPWEGLAGTLAVLIAQTVVLTFKSFMEASDLNIAVSRRILDIIHSANATIAQGQILANQFQKTATSLEAGMSGLKPWDGPTRHPCVPGPNSPSESGNLPPKEWFDPIEDNFIPEPQIWMISLGMMPMNWFPGWFGPPLHPVFGPIYWALDYKPEPNWLHGPATKDWLTQLFNNEQSLMKVEADDSECTVALGLPPPGTFGDGEL